MTANTAASTATGVGRLTSAGAPVSIQALRRSFGTVRALDGLTLDDVAPAGKMPVPTSGAATASYTTFDGLTIDLRLVERGKTDWIAIAATGSGKAAAEAKQIEERVSGWSYAIPSYKATMIKTKLADLIEPKKSS